MISASQSKQNSTLPGLQRRPGKYAHTGAVDAGFLHQPHILLQDVRPVQPLFRIIVAAVDEAAYLRKQNFFSIV